MKFDHEKLDVYQVSLEFVAWAFELSQELTGLHRHARDQLLRASQSILLNIAEGNGKRSPAERRRFFEFARGSAQESAATIDVLIACHVVTQEEAREGKQMLLRIVSMLTKMTESHDK